MVNTADQNKMLNKIYKTAWGRFWLNTLLKHRFVSKLASIPIKSRFSKKKIAPFIAANNIDMSPYPEREYKSFNDFFTRKIKPGARPFSTDPKTFISPCDAVLSLCTINDDAQLQIKGHSYTVTELLQSGETGAKYRGGTALVFRLRVQDYHRYIFIDSGTAASPQKINGKLHTVSPIGLESGSVLQTNSREWQTLKCDNLGEIVQVEVGAMMVGKIVNSGANVFMRGDEKGYFCFGGSTIVLLVPADKLELAPRFAGALDRDEEIRVLQGETVGKIISPDPA